MTGFGFRHKTHRVVVAAAVGMALVIGCAGSAARAADDDDDALLDTKIVRGILKGLGLRRDEPNIDYRERSPLVLPADKQLPQPETSSPTKTAGWPDDPDLKKAKKRKDDERNRKPYTEGVDDRPLLPSQVSGGSASGTTGSTPRGGEAPGRPIEETSRPSSQAELGAKGLFSNIGSLWAPKEEYSTFTGEPPRASLIDPPAGYRTPSPNQPFGVGKEKWKPPAVVDRQEPVR